MRPRALRLAPGGESGRLRRLVELPAGRRAKWLVLAAWLAAAAVCGPLQPRLQDATTNDPASFLPRGSQSKRVLDVLDERFPSGDAVPALLVWRRDGGLTGGDRADVADAVRRIRGARIPDTAPPSRPRVSDDGAAALVVVPVTAPTIDGIEPAVKELRRLVGRGTGGLESAVSGPAATSVDAVEIFGSIDATLLLATSALILLLLVAVYRSPVIALVPLAVVAVAYVVAAALVLGLVGATPLEVNGQTTGLLIILMFGAGTDYCLLIVARFREELRRTTDAHEAMAHAVDRTSPAILSSGGTVVLALLLLLLGELGSIRAAGPVLALGVAVTVFAGLTLLPAVLAVLGRRAFWPAVPRLQADERPPARAWRAVGEAVRARPRLTLAVTAAALVAAALGNAVDLPGLSLGAGFRSETESVDGQRLLERSFPAGEAAATNVVVRAAAQSRALAALRDVEGVASARPAGRSDDGGLAELRVTLASDPYADAAVAAVAPLRDAVRAVDATALVGGPTAEEADSRDAARRDARLIVPLVLAAILGILAGLLRALVAPLYLVATVVLGFAATLGLSTLGLRYVLDAPGTDASLPLFVFVFVVALGVDYNIFLITRVREEAARLGTPAGVIAGLERTGGVITSAGLVLAGTFLVLMTLPLEQLFQLGLTVALGLLLDTFVVRTLLVPALAFLAGERSWWPGDAARGARAAPRDG